MQLVVLIEKTKTLEKMGDLNCCLKHKESLSTKIVCFGLVGQYISFKLYCSFVKKTFYCQEDVWVKGQYL